MSVNSLNREDIKKIIPHRDPMLLIDEVREIAQGQSIVAAFHVDPDREIFKGHFPGEAVLPGVYTVECMAQASDILLLSQERYAGTTPYFIGIDKVRFFRKIAPGDTIEIHSSISAEKREKAIATCSAVVYNKGEIAATGDVTLAMR
ncbi:MAG TPA: 3-hydroxyacyl-ACP dehydratase FabZ [Bacillota bacterium]|nr:3-hydroxyacyl-ACP dehydratase FabZ [Bacillota bacterium]